MKKLFIKSLMAVGVAGLMGLTSVAIAAEFNWYGSIRAGVTTRDTLGSVDLGSTESEGTTGLFSRIGIRSTTDLGNGQSAGGQIEIAVRGNAVQNGARRHFPLEVRHHNVWIGGGWGRLTLGQQNNPYNSAANWDQAWFLGGNRRFMDGGYRVEGISYSSNLAGAFSFDVTVTGNSASAEDTDRLIATAHYDFGLATVNLGFNNSDLAPYDKTVISANGSSADLDWYLAYEDNKSNGVRADRNTVGVFLGYNLTDGDRIYLEHEATSGQPNATLLGYSRSLGEDITFIAEHQSLNKNLNLVLKYNF